MNLRIKKYSRNLFDISIIDEVIKINDLENISLDIGSGEGEFISKLAKENPKDFFIGIEIKYGRILKSLKRVDNFGLKNIKFIYGDISNLLGTVLISKNIKKIFINNPDPWPKDKHIKKRIIKSDLLDKLYKLMKRKGQIIIKTDSQDYLNFIKKEISNSKFKVWQKYKDHKLPLSKFQENYNKINKKIYAIVINKN
tara:strand:+ start:22185 stop:22775 length:591 start_codon:yes stop_codon:yes gene_type:complete